jgi:hypothetical protein
VPDPVKRAPITILCPDVKGYSRLIDADEVATLSTLKEYRGAITGFVACHEGRVVNTSGDSMLAEFDSVVEAAQCAAEIQREQATRNGALLHDRRMEFRIGINLGDAIIEGDYIYGEGALHHHPARHAHPPDGDRADLNDAGRPQATGVSGGGALRCEAYQHCAAAARSPRRCAAMLVASAP